MGQMPGTLFGLKLKPKAGHGKMSGFPYCNYATATVFEACACKVAAFQLVGITQVFQRHDFGIRVFN